MCMLHAWVSLCDGDTHDVELAHAFHKNTSTPLSKYELLAARSVLGEARSAHAAWTAATAAASPLQGGAASEPGFAAAIADMGGVGVGASQQGAIVAAGTGGASAQSPGAKFIARGGGVASRSSDSQRVHASHFWVRSLMQSPSGSLFCFDLFVRPSLQRFQERGRAWRFTCHEVVSQPLDEADQNDIRPRGAPGTPTRRPKYDLYFSGLGANLSISNSISKPQVWPKWFPDGDDKASRARQGRTAPFKSALQLFHNHCARRDTKAGVIRKGVLSPVSKEYWQRVKGEWTELSDGQRLYYEELAAADSNRACSAKVMAQLLPESPCQQLVPASADADAPSNAIVATPVALQDESRWLARVGGHDGQPGDLPIDARLYRRILEREAVAFRSGHPGEKFKACKCASLRFHESVACQAKARGAIPPAVLYDRPCSGVCLASAHPATASLAIQLEAELSRRVQGVPVQQLGVILRVKAPIVRGSVTTPPSSLLSVIVLWPGLLAGSLASSPA